MEPDTKMDLVTGAFSYSGSHIAERLLASGRHIRTLTFHPGRPHQLHEKVQAFRYQFDDPLALTRALEGVTTLYNTYIGFASTTARRRLPARSPTHGCCLRLLVGPAWRGLFI